MSNNGEETADFSWFSKITQSSLTGLHSIIQQFKDDECSHKLDLAFPCYRNENGKPLILSVVRTAETVLANDLSLTKERLHPLGYNTFNKCAIVLLLGENSPTRIQQRAFAIQTISATGAFRTGAEFLVQHFGMTTVYNTHQSLDYMDIFTAAGFKQCQSLRYINRSNLTLDIQGLLQDLRLAEEKSTVILQISGHNPTGYDPSLEEWESIADIIKARKLFPFFYNPYQGFATGNVDEDAAAIRLFEKRNIEFFCAQSFVWNFGLYNERVGCLSVCVRETDKVNAVKSQLISITKKMYSTPPSHGARIVAFILGDRMLSQQWKDTLVAIVQRLKQMRSYLREELERLGAPGTWQHITNQVGIFCFTGLNDIQVEYMKKQHRVYLLCNGALNISSLNLYNVEYVAKAICETLTTIPPSYLAGSII